MVKTKTSKKTNYGRVFAVRLEPVDVQRLASLKTKLELRWPVIVRQAIRSMAEKEGIA
jgi:hypothetical protein